MAVFHFHPAAAILHLCLLFVVGSSGSSAEETPSDAAALVAARPSNLTVAEPLDRTADNASIASSSAANDTSSLSDTAQLALAFQNEVNDGQALEQTEPRQKRYRLLYFGSRGRAEPIRLMFHYAGQRFDDFYIPRDEWTPFYKNRLAGGEAASSRDEAEFAQAKVDEFADFHRDVSDEFHDLFYPLNQPKSAEETRKAETIARRYFPIYERQLRNARAGLLFGATPTWADLMVADFLESVRVTFPHIFDYSPRLRCFHADVHSLPQLTAYLSARPNNF